MWDSAVEGSFEAGDSSTGAFGSAEDDVDAMIGFCGADCAECNAGGYLRKNFKRRSGRVAANLACCSCLVAIVSWSGWLGDVWVRVEMHSRIRAKGELGPSALV